MAFSPHTHELLAAAGLKWHGDARDNDVPRVVNFKNGEMAHIPWSDFTDNRVLRSSSMDLWDVYREAFDYLYLREPGQLPADLDALPQWRPADDHGDLPEDFHLHRASSPMSGLPRTARSHAGC